MPRYSPLNPHVLVVRDWIDQDCSIVEIVAKCQNFLGIKTNESSVRKFIDRHSVLQQAWDRGRARRDAKKLVDGQASPEGFTQIDDDTIIITAAPGKRVDEVLIDDILSRRQLDPDDWEVKQILDNQWEANSGSGTKITLFQFKIWLTRKTPIDLIFPAVPEFPAWTNRVGPKTHINRPILVWVGGDHQTPWHNKELHQLVCNWLDYNKPHIGVVHGDLSDFGFISKHRDKPDWDASVQECVQASFDILYDYRNANPDTAWKLRKGNHDDRLRNETLERAERMYGVTAAHYPGDEPEEWVYSLNHLLHLKRMGIEYIEPKGTYEFEQVPLSDYLAVRHGHLISKNGALQTAVELGHSIVLGHTHRQSIARKTLWNSITRQWRVVTAIETGCLCDIVGGLGFANAGSPDWQPGFVGITIFPDGNFSADLATYTQDGVLRWRDQEFSL